MMIMKKEIQIENKWKNKNKNKNKKRDHKILNNKIIL